MLWFLTSYMCSLDNTLSVFLFLAYVVSCISGSWSYVERQLPAKPYWKLRKDMHAENGVGSERSSPWPQSRMEPAAFVGEAEISTSLLTSRPKQLPSTPRNSSSFWALELHSRQRDRNLNLKHGSEPTEKGKGRSPLGEISCQYSTT